MERTPEPELMDEESQVDAYANADFAASDDAFVASFIERFGSDFNGPVVDLGCGPGNIALRLARTIPNARIVAIDGAPRMLEAARRRAGDLLNVRFEQACLPSAQLDGLQAGAVVSNSLLHHLHDPQALWGTIRRLTSPGTPVFVGDLRRPPTVAAVDALVARYAAGDPEVLRNDFRASLHAAFEPDEIRAQLVVAGLSTLVVEAVGDRHVRVTGRA